MKQLMDYYNLVTHFQNEMLIVVYKEHKCEDHLNKTSVVFQADTNTQHMKIHKSVSSF